MNKNATDNEPHDDDPTQPVLVRYDYPETPEQRKIRLAQGKPAPTYAFMCRRVEDEK